MSATAYSVAVRLGTPDAPSWRRIDCYDRAESIAVIKGHEKLGIKALAYRTRYLDAIGVPEGWTA